MTNYHAPKCVAIEAENDLVCGTPMQVLAERDPSFGPNWRPGTWVFRCPRCSSIRSITKELVDRYVEAR